MTGFRWNRRRQLTVPLSCNDPCRTCRHHSIHSRRRRLRTLTTKHYTHVLNSDSMWNWSLLCCFILFLYGEHRLNYDFMRVWRCVMYSWISITISIRTPDVNRRHYVLYSCALFFTRNRISWLAERTSTISRSEIGSYRF